ncbi:arylsulfatase [Candidatus Poribacteria bacterium]|nr:MAG: arylsulfatase [Candidatus Poribacteria bacterium]
MVLATTQPNVLWIYGEDLSPDLGCYDTPAVQTPNIDRLAEESTRFTNAFATCPVCSPSRSALITGTYQTHFDAHNHRSNREKPLRDDMKLITDCFREAGYFTCNSPGPPYNRRGKTDFNFQREQPFDGIDWSERAEGQPFYAQINIPDTHRVFKPDPERPINPNDVQLPPYYPNHPLTRKDWALYLESIQILDRKVGEILERLDAEGLSENTIVFFISDHGRAHIRCKQFLYDGGIHIPLIVRWPGNIEAEVVSDELVSGVDLTPTTLSLVGLDIPNYVQGQIFLGPDAESRDAVFAARDRCDGTDDRIRCIRTSRYKLIRNYHPELPYMQFNGYKKLQYPLWTLIRILAEKDELSEAQQHFLQQTRPAAELYDLQTDPHEVNNLADDKRYDAVRNDLNRKLDAWIEATGDMGETPESDEITTYWDENMMESFRKSMKGRGLSPEISDADYLAWWERKLL